MQMIYVKFIFSKLSDNSYLNVLRCPYILFPSNYKKKGYSAKPLFNIDYYSIFKYYYFKKKNKT